MGADAIHRNDHPQRPRLRAMGLGAPTLRSDPAGREPADDRSRAAERRVKNRRLLAHVRELQRKPKSLRKDAQQ
jgi:hypothetical protein